MSIPEFSKASLGKRLRYLRKRLGYTITVYATLARLGHNTIARIERDETKVIQPWILGRILPLLAGRFQEAFPDARGDVYEYLMPTKRFGDWLRNLRLRHGLQQKELAKALGVARYTIQRYETHQCLPKKAVRYRLEQRFGLNGDLDKFIKPINCQ